MTDPEQTRPRGIPVLDWEHLHMMCGHDPGFEREIVGDFLAQAELTLARLAGAVTAQEAEAIRFAAHALSGSARTLGAVALADAVHELEAGGRTRDVADAARLLERVRAEWERLRDLLKDYLDRLAA